MEKTYTPPVDALLTLGEEAARAYSWPDYREMGLEPDHIPDLVHMVSDPDLLDAPSDTARVWAPLHAWRALGQLGAEEAIAPLLALLDKYPDDDYVFEEVPRVFGLIGPAALEPVSQHLSALSRPTETRIAIARGLKEIAKKSPEVRDHVVSLLSEMLQKAADQDEALNGFLINDLIDLDAVEAAPVMEKAFAADAVDCTINGDWEEVQIALGLLDERTTPPTWNLFDDVELPLEPMWDVGKAAWSGTGVRKPQEKAKRKMAKKSRKQNRKK